MLSKEVCGKCKHCVAAKAIEPFEIDWKKGMVACYFYEHGVCITYINNKPPEYCPYVLEHTVNEPVAIIRQNLPMLNKFMQEHHDFQPRFSSKNI